MTMTKIEGVEGEVQVVLGAQVHDLTKRGWVLVGVVDDTDVHLDVKQVPPIPGAYYQQYLQECTSRGFAVAKYIVSLSRDTVVADLRTHLADAHLAKDEALKVGAALTEARMALETKNEELTRSFAGRGVDLNEQRSRNNVLNVRLRKMEADLAKIRTAIGELRLKEILDA